LVSFFKPLHAVVIFYAQIEVIAPPEATGVNDTQFTHKLQEKNYLDGSRQWKEFNTSELQLATRLRHQAVMMPSTYS
jgi:hypothetical protein